MSGDLVVQPFSNGEFNLSVTAHPNDGFHVSAPEVAHALGIRDAYRLLETIPAEEKGYTTACTPGGDQRTTYLTEAGFYRALGQRQAARISDETVRDLVSRFQTWVYRDVLPALRRGETPANVPAQRHEIPQTLQEALRLAADQMDRAVAAEAKVAELEPAAEQWNVLATASGDLSVADAAKILSRDPQIKLGRDRLFTVLRDLRWIYRQQIDQRHRCYQSAIESGRLSEIPQSHYHPRTGELVLDPPQIRVTVKGMGWLHQHLGGVSPPALPA
jgi:phage antirepressor YoqD-like protein